MSTLLSTRVFRRAASLLVGTATATAAFAVPAAAHNQSAGHYIVDTDRVYVFHVGRGIADVTATHFFANSRLQSQVIGTVNNLGRSAREFVRVIWHYADGTGSAGNSRARAPAGTTGCRSMSTRGRRRTSIEWTFNCVGRGVRRCRRGGGDGDAVTCR